MRERDAPGIAEAVWGIIAEALEGVEAPDQHPPQGETKAVGLKGKTARDVAEMAVRVAGDYVCE